MVPEPRRSSQASIEFRPSASLEILKLRAALLRATREFFDARDFYEVETPHLLRDVVIDAWLEPFATDGREGPSCTTSTARDELFLQTSPENAMKRLLAAGAGSIYQLGRAYRRAELGPLHNPEFTMLEWYRVGDTHHEQMQFVEEYVLSILQRAVSLDTEFGLDIAPLAVRGPFERLAYDDAFLRYAGTRVLTLENSALRNLAVGKQITVPNSLGADDRDGWLNLLLAELVEPQLGREQPTFLYDYPASQSALAKVRTEDGVAERFELYFHGIELCNGYHELTDAVELRARMQHQSRIRIREGKRPLPLPERLLAAIEHGLPNCSGVALGFDRLVMLAAGVKTIQDVMAFPSDRS